MVPAKLPDWPLECGVARVGHLVLVSVVIDERGEVGDGISVRGEDKKVAQWKSPWYDMACRW